MSGKIPSYVYMNDLGKDLNQGDLIELSGNFLEKFQGFYPEVTTSNSDGYCMVISQSCDLVRRNGDCKSKYINLCMVRPFNEMMTKVFTHNKTKDVKDGDYFLFGSSQYDEVKSNIWKLINNSESKNRFFLPKHSKLKNHLLVQLDVMFAVRSEIYADILANRQLSLASEFRAKIGKIVGDLYSRVATSDLFDHGLQEEQVSAIVESMMDDLKIVNVLDGSNLEALRKKSYLINEKNINAIKEKAKEIEMEKGVRGTNKIISATTNNNIDILTDCFQDHAFIQDLIQLAKNNQGKFKKALNNKFRAN